MLISHNYKISVNSFMVDKLGPSGPNHSLGVM